MSNYLHPRFVSEIRGVGSDRNPEPLFQGLWAFVDTLNCPNLYEVPSGRYLANNTMPGHYEAASSGAGQAADASARPVSFESGAAVPDPGIACQPTTNPGAVPTNLTLSSQNHRQPIKQSVYRSLQTLPCLHRTIGNQCLQCSFIAL